MKWKLPSVSRAWEPEPLVLENLSCNKIIITMIPAGTKRSFLKEYNEKKD